MKYASIRIAISRSKRDALKQRVLELEIVPSVIIVYGVFRLLDLLNGKCVSVIDHNFIKLAIAEYKPYNHETDICYASLSWVISDKYCTRMELSKQLASKGYRTGSIFKAFYNVLLKCDATSIPHYSDISGSPLSSVTPESVRRLKNAPFMSSVSLSNSVYQQLNAIAESAKTSIYRMISRALDILLAIEFNGEVFVENSDVFRDNILTYNRKVTGITGKGFYYTYKTANLERGVRILYLLEKYGIPGKNELVYRIIRFILLSHAKGISLKPLHVDGSDYNETRMVHNAYRKEVTYAADHH